MTGSRSTLFQAGLAAAIFALITAPTLIATPIVTPLTPAPTSSDPAVIGKWEPDFLQPFEAIHAVMLPTGKLFLFIDQQDAGVWDPGTGQFSFRPLGGFADIFCAGHALLPDGRVIVAGGSYEGLNLGINTTFFFDAYTETWAEGPPMAFDRYYPTLVTLPDGRVLAIAGEDKTTVNVPQIEVMTPGPGEHWEVLEGADLSMGSYPRVHLLPGGNLVKLGSETEVAFLDPNQPAAGWNHSGLNMQSPRGGGGSVLLPGLDRVLAFGGYVGREIYPTATADLLDLRGATPSLRAVASMHRERADVSPLLLADGNLLAIGGTADDSRSFGIREPEMFNSVTETWTLMAPADHGRTYHTTVMLLPDGRVLVGGSNYETAEGSAGHPMGHDHIHDGLRPEQVITALPPSGIPGYPQGQIPAPLYTAEIYDPPYLFKGPRPVIAAAPSAAHYGGTFLVSSPDAAQVSRVALVRLGSFTHSFDMQQRYVDLQFEAGASNLTVQEPADATIAPPGDYMLFVLNDRGVPAVAPIVHVT